MKFTESVAGLYQNLCLKWTAFASNTREGAGNSAPKGDLPCVRAVGRIFSVLATGGLLLFSGSPSLQAIEAVLTHDITLTKMVAPAYAGRASTLIIGGTPSAGNIALLKFDVTSVLPAGIGSPSISKATLRVYSPALKGGSLDAKMVTSPATWTEDTAILSSSSVVLSGTVTSTALFSIAGKFTIFDVTELVKKWVDNPEDNCGLALVASSNSLAKIVLSSKEGGYGHSPSLDITLHGGGGSAEGSAPGERLYNGIDKPDEKTGLKGDAYLNTSTGILYVKSDTTWDNGTSLKGAKGDTGATITHIDPPMGDVSMGPFTARKSQ